MELDFYTSKKSNTIDNLKSKLVNEIDDALFILTVSANNHYNLVFVNNPAYEMFEILPQAILSNTLFAAFNRILPQDKKTVRESFTDAVQKKQKWNIKFRTKLPTKGLCWFKIKTKVETDSEGNTFFYGQIIDVSIDKAQQSRLKALEIHLKLALETSNSGIWNWDIKSNTISCSTQDLKILELNNMHTNSLEKWESIIHPDDFQKYQNALNDHLENKSHFFENFHRVLTSSGKYKWILNKGKIIERDAQGKPLKVIGTHTDVSSQKEKELELMKKIELYSKKNGRLVNFSHIVSHNLNAHAGNFKLLLDMIDLEENFADKRETMKYLRTVSNDLNKTIEDLSQIVNIENDTDIIVKPLNLNKYVNRTLDIVSSYSYKNTATIINNIPVDATINFNPAYLESVLQNLCTNAVKYADPNKFLVIQFDFFMENGKKVLTIKDNGLGIDLEKYGHLLFGMYKTFHKHEKANGIGLYITKNQIESMNGTVNVESQVGKGTIFKIVFDDQKYSNSGSI